MLDWHGFLVLEYNIPINRPGVYSFWNTHNGKVYIGISGRKGGVAARCRDRRQCEEDESKLGHAIRKYGRSSFLIVPFYYVTSTEVKTNRRLLLTIEAKLIAEFNSVKNGYNIQEASEGVGPYGEAFRARIRASWADPEVKARRLANFVLSEFLERTLEAIRKSPRSAAMYDAFRKKLRDPDYQKQLQEKAHTPEICQKHSEYIRQLWHDNPLKWVHCNGKSLRIPIDDPIPDGWSAGRSAGFLGFWITDGSSNIKLRAGSLIPDGWRPGRTMPRNQKGIFIARKSLTRSTANHAG